MIINEQGVWRCERIENIVDYLKDGMIIYNFDDFYEKIIKNRHGKIIRFGHEKKRLGKVKITQVKRYVTKIKRIKKGQFAKLCKGIYNMRDSLTIVVNKKEWQVAYMADKPILHMEKRKGGFVECNLFHKP